MDGDRILKMFSTSGVWLPCHDRIRHQVGDEFRCLRLRFEAFAPAHLIRIRCRSIRTCGRLVHPELVHGSKCGRSLGFEVLPAIEVGHGRWLGKAYRETLERKCIQYEAAKLHASRRKKQLDFAQCDVMLLHMKQEVATFT